MLSKVCSGLSRFKQPRGFSRGSALPLSILEVSCLVRPRLCFCLLPGLAPLGVMSEVCSGSSRLGQSRGTLIGSASLVLLFYTRASGFSPQGVVSDFFVRTFPPFFFLPGWVLAQDEAFLDRLIFYSYRFFFSESSCCLFFLSLGLKIFGKKDVSWF